LDRDPFIDSCCVNDVHQTTHRKQWCVWVAVDETDSVSWELHLSRAYGYCLWIFLEACSSSPQKPQKNATIQISSSPQKTRTVFYLKIPFVWESQPLFIVIN